MWKNKVLVFVLLALAVSDVTVSQAEQRQLGQVVYITVSKACGCMLELCQAGEIIVGNVFSGERKRLLKRIDYSTEKEAAPGVSQAVWHCPGAGFTVSRHAGQTAVDGCRGAVGKRYSGKAAGFRQLKPGAGGEPPHR
jgi:hypothetical protein